MATLRLGQAERADLGKSTTPAAPAGSRTPGPHHRPASRLVANAHALLDRVQAGKLSSSDAQQRLQLDREQSVSAGDFAEKVSDIQRVFLGSCGLNPNAQPVSVCGPLSTLFGEAQALLGQVQMGELSPQDAEQQLKADRDQAKHSP